MHDARRVHGRQGIDQLPNHLGDEERGQGAEVADQRGHRSPGHDGHGEQHPVVLARPAERHDDVRVMYPHRLLADEPQHGDRVRLAQHLGRDHAAGA